MTHGRRSLGASGVLFSLLLFGCASPATSPPRSSSEPPAASVAAGPIDCGDPTPVVLDETPSHTPWAVTGSFRFATYGMPIFRPGFPTKVPIDVNKPLETPVDVRGWRCADGHPLRFWYRGGVPFHSVPDVRAMETAGDLVATLKPVRYIDSWMGIGAGYMLFTTPGKWKVSVFQGDQLLASAVFLVSCSSCPEV